jgi:SAM-dependent methyltransferase
METKALRRRLGRAVDWVAAAHIDLRLWLTGKADPDLPPLRLRFVGAGDFRAVGEELRDVLIRFGLKPTDRVLDVGSGAGRVAIPLTGYLNSAGSYDGFDVVRRAVSWCRSHITRRHRNFRFHHVKVRNSEYRGSGAAASEFRFPFNDASFDFVFATSLFTHLMLTETRRYLHESARVLAPDGRLLATFFLLNEHAREVLPRLEEHYRFPIDQNPLRFIDRENPAFGVAIDEGVLIDLIREAGFSRYEIHYGRWAERQEGVTFQDLVLCFR